MRVRSRVPLRVPLRVIFGVGRIFRVRLRVRCGCCTHGCERRVRIRLRIRMRGPECGCVRFRCGCECETSAGAGAGSGAAARTDKPSGVWCAGMQITCGCEFRVMVVLLRGCVDTSYSRLGVPGVNWCAIRGDFVRVRKKWEWNHAAGAGAKQGRGGCRRQAGAQWVRAQSGRAASRGAGLISLQFNKINWK